MKNLKVSSHLNATTSRHLILKNLEAKLAHREVKKIVDLVNIFKHRKFIMTCNFKTKAEHTII